ncbi:hypothetical protein MHBO_000559, partial [Bonamia ostreae]
MDKIISQFDDIVESYKLDKHSEVISKTKIFLNGISKNFKRFVKTSSIKILDIVVISPLENINQKICDFVISISILFIHSIFKSNGDKTKTPIFNFIVNLLHPFVIKLKQKNKILGQKRLQQLRKICFKFICIKNEQNSENSKIWTNLAKIKNFLILLFSQTNTNFNDLNENLFLVKSFFDCEKDLFSDNAKIYSKFLDD